MRCDALIYVSWRCMVKSVDIARLRATLNKLYYTMD
jgi:hypothetical protein